MTEEEKAAAAEAERVAAAEAAAIVEAEAAAAAEAAEAARKANDKTTRTAAEVDAEIDQLRKEAADANRAADEARAVAAKFKGIDPVVAKENAKKVSDAEAATREAERKQAEAEGNFERLRELQNEDFDRKFEEIKAERDAALVKVEEVTTRNERATRTSAFAASKFFAGETVLTPSKAERLFGDHVEIEDGEIVVYDAPSSASKRTKMMDAKGNALSFEVAIQKVFEKDPDRDTLTKSKVKPGAGTKSEDVSDPGLKASNDRLTRLTAAVAVLRK